MMDDKMTLGQWVLTLLLASIPCVNIVLLIIWAVGDGGGYVARKTFSQAYLIFMVVIYVISFIFGMITGAGAAMLGASAGASMLFL